MTNQIKNLSRLTFIAIAVMGLNTLMSAQGVIKKTEKIYYYANPENKCFLKRKHLTRSAHYLYDEKAKLLEVTVEGDNWVYQYTDSTRSTIDSTFLSHTIYSKDNFTKRTYFYNEYDRLERMEYWQYAYSSPEKYLIFKELKKYDTEGDLKQTVRLYSNGWIWNIWKYIDYEEYLNYADLSSFINKVETSIDPLDRSGFYSINDSLGRPLIDLDFFAESIVSVSKHVYEYNTEVEYIYLGKDEDVNNLYMIVELHYNNDSKIKKRITHSINSNVGIDEYKYNRKGQLIKILHYNYTTLTGYTKYSYQQM